MLIPGLTTWKKSCINFNDNFDNRKPVSILIVFGLCYMKKIVKIGKGTILKYLN